MRAHFIEQMAMYSAYHRDGRNKATHFVGVPAIAYSLLIPMAFVKLFAVGGFSITLAFVFTTAVLIYWIAMDRPFGLATAILFFPAVFIAEWIVRQGATIAWIAFAVLFVGGWIIQLVGHAFEGRKPALADNLLQVLIAPVFLVAETVFAMGGRRTLHDEVMRRMPAYLPKGTAAAAAE